MGEYRISMALLPLYSDKMMTKFTYTLDENENATTFYSQKCFVCSGSIDDEIHISKSNTIQAFIHS